MPGMDGITLIKELRNLASCKFIPILMLTTGAGEDKKQEGKQAAESQAPAQDAPLLRR